jgi:hypothetical protein
MALSRPLRVKSHLRAASRHGTEAPLLSGLSYREVLGSDGENLAQKNKVFGSE